MAFYDVFALHKSMYRVLLQFVCNISQCRQFHFIYNIYFIWITKLVFQLVFVHSEIDAECRQFQPNHSEFTLIKNDKVTFAEARSHKAMSGDSSFGTTSVIYINKSNTSSFRSLWLWKLVRFQNYKNLIQWFSLFAICKSIQWWKASNIWRLLSGFNAEMIESQTTIIR